MLTKHWIWQDWKLLTLLDHCHLVKIYFPELNSTSSGHGAHWEISSDPWNSLIFHHAWVLVTSPCHKIILWSLPLPSFFALQIRWSNYAAHLMTEPLRSACYHIISGIFRSSFNFGLCFKTISLFDLLQSLSYSDWITFVWWGPVSLPQAPCYSLQPWLPLVAKFLHTMMPHVALGVGYTFFFVFDYIPCSMWDLGSPTRDPTHAPLQWKTVFVFGPPGKFQLHFLKGLCNTFVKEWLRAVSPLNIYIPCIDHVS